MTKPTKPTVPPAPSRANPGPVFSETADTFAAFQATLADYMDATADFVDDRADAALAAALLGTLPPLTGQASKFTRVNPGGTALEFRTPDQVRADLSINGTGAETVAVTNNAFNILRGGQYLIPIGATGSPNAAFAYRLTHMVDTTVPFGAQIAIEGGTNRLFVRDKGSDIWGRWLEITQNNAGEVAFFARNSAPNGWLKANGAEISRTVYADLFAAIGTTFGAGNGTTTFNLPDLRGEFLRAWDDGRGVDGGRVFGSGQGDAIRNITGAAGNNYRGFLNTFSGAFASNGNLNSDWGSSGGVTPANGFTFDASRVVPTASENRPRNIALLACIKF